MNRKQRSVIETWRLQLRCNTIQRPHFCFYFYMCFDHQSSLTRAFKHINKTKPIYVHCCGENRDKVHLARPHKNIKSSPYVHISVLFTFEYASIIILKWIREAFQRAPHSKLLRDISEYGDHIKHIFEEKSAQKPFSVFTFDEEEKQRKKKSHTQIPHTRLVRFAFLALLELKHTYRTSEPLLSFHERIIRGGKTREVNEQSMYDDERK